MRLLAAALVVTALGLTSAWDDVFKSTECYKYGLENIDDRMPQNLGNLIALVEKWEEQHLYQNPESIAEGLIHRYKKDGIVYKPGVISPWLQTEAEESNKFDLVSRVLSMTEEVPRDTFEPREECALHFLASHSTDIFPHAGVDDVWESGRRVRRSEQNSNARYALPADVDPAKHPIENGIMYTPSGPVAVGTLLAGIAASEKTSEMTVRNIFGTSVEEYMPTEMLNAGLHPKHISTVAGDIGQSALVTMQTTTIQNRYLGPSGMFGNSTAAPKLFTLEDNNNGITSYLTRPEIFAGIDALLIQKVLQSSTWSSIKLSQILRMYYSEYGLPGYPEFRACNRMQAFKQIDMSKIEEQALHFMFAYSTYFSDMTLLIQENPYSLVESEMSNHLRNVISAFNSFVGSYGYDDYDQCPVYGSSDVKTENQVDLILVYSHEGGTNEMEKQREYITHLANMLGVGTKRSRLGVLDGKKADWIYPMTNFSNVADWGSNFTEEESMSYGSGSDTAAVLDALTVYFSSYYKELRGDSNNAAAHSQIVLWNMPSSPTMDMEEFIIQMKAFRLNYPDVYILMVGKSKNYGDVLVDQSKDFFTNNELYQEKFAEKIAERIRQIPTVFVYPACDTHNSNYTNYREQNHLYTGYVTPNFTTYVHIAPHNFRFSGYMKLMLSNSDVTMCKSRKSMSVDKNAEDYQCIEDSGEFEFWDLCGRYLEECDPIFLSVTGKPTSGSRCNDEECEYPNQVKFELRHEGMTCGSWLATSSLMVLCVSLLTHLLH